MITLTWFQAFQVLVIIGVLLILPTMAKITREGEAEAREAKRRSDEQWEELQQRLDR